MHQLLIIWSNQNGFLCAPPTLINNLNAFALMSTRVLYLRSCLCVCLCAFDFEWALNFFSNKFSDRNTKREKKQQIKIWSLFVELKIIYTKHIYLMNTKKYLNKECPFSLEKGTQYSIINYAKSIKLFARRVFLIVISLSSSLSYSSPIPLFLFRLPKTF